MLKNKTIFKVVLVLFLIAQFQFLTLLDLPLLRIPGTTMSFNPRSFSFVNPLRIDSAGLSSASATLSNPRLSYYGATSAITNAGSQLITILGAGSYGDLNTGNLFPNDGLAIGLNGALQVASISSQTVFTIKSPLPVTVGGSTPIYATQSGTLTADFYTSASLPVGGKIVLEIPAAASNANDGAPDTASSIAGNGFDFNNLGTGNITCPNASFTASVSGSNGPAPHTVTCTLGGSTAIAPGAHFTVQVGTGGKGLINPAPIYTGHTQGVADIYSINVYTRDGSNNNIESVPIKTAPVEGVLVTATIDETLSFTVQGVTADSGSYCGITRDANSVDTTATSVPWNVINSDYNNNINRHNANQTLIVTTNAPYGYTVYAEENDQMGKDGNICTGAAPSVEPYTYGTSLCVRDYDYNTATYINGSDWVPSTTNYGFGYSLQNVPATGGTDAQFQYNDSSRAFNAKHFADQEVGSQSKYAAGAQIMSNTGPVSGSSVYVCYRIHIPASQPAGYYYNKLKYTAVARF